MFKNVDGRTDDGRTAARVPGILLANPRSLDSGELKTIVTLGLTFLASIMISAKQL